MVNVTVERTDINDGKAAHLGTCAVELAIKRKLGAYEVRCDYSFANVRFRKGQDWCLYEMVGVGDWIKQFDSYARAKKALVQPIKFTLVECQNGVLV